MCVVLSRYRMHAYALGYCPAAAFYTTDSKALL